MTGRARANVHDGVITLGDEEGDSGDTMILKGVDERSTVGLLSLFEHYQSCIVCRSRLPLCTSTPHALRQLNPLSSCHCPLFPLFPKSRLVHRLEAI